MNLDTEVESGADARKHGVERIRHDYSGSERRRELRKQRLAESGEVGMAEGCLEFAETHAESRARLHVDPCLLEERTARCGCVDREAVGDDAECLAGESEHSVGDGEPGIGHIVLIVGRIEAAVVVVVDGGSSLHKQVGFEDKVGIFSLEREALASGKRHHTILCILIVLRLCIGHHRCCCENGQSRDEFLHFRRNILLCYC